MTRLPGHSLRNEGAAHGDDGRLLDGTRLGVQYANGAGRGKCSCGVLSEPLPSGRARRKWHRGHKEQILIGGRVPEVPDAPA